MVENHRETITMLNKI